MMTLEAWLAEIRREYHADNNVHECECGSVTFDANYDGFHRVAVIVCAECGAFIDEIDAPDEPGDEESIRY